MHQFLMVYLVLHTENRKGCLLTEVKIPTFSTLAVSIYESIVLEIFHSK